MGAFYRSAQRSILGLDRRTRNEILVAVSARPPLEVFVEKQVLRYYRAVGKVQEGEERLVSRVV